ncbi:hypothetical protein NOM01_04570 [Sporolactobacillus sp. STSJ-5]|uniref:hypothetical protein n=1 Tax=Sporolactobacillus sp. STSJ-5 TaxID=2965076 RepID=UPI0021032327|nr:hypothetical protein [Sporolactobacillus sp. STSJ-5]MCQ2009268.1 hypothetical protein [Sporolactobacillus sp. STSJ-5]
MGLLLNQATFDTGITLNNVYVRVYTVSGGKDAGKIIADFFKSRDDATNGARALKTEIIGITFDVTSSAKNFVIQAYDSLKTLTEFQGAMDIMESGQSI